MMLAEDLIERTALHLQKLVFVRRLDTSIVFASPEVQLFSRRTRTSTCAKATSAAGMHSPPGHPNAAVRWWCTLMKVGRGDICGRGKRASAPCRARVFVSQPVSAVARSRCADFAADCTEHRGAPGPD